MNIEALIVFIGCFISGIVGYFIGYKAGKEHSSQPKK